MGLLGIPYLAGYSISFWATTLNPEPQILHRAVANQLKVNQSDDANGDVNCYEIVRRRRSVRGEASDCNIVICILYSDLHVSGPGPSLISFHT